MIKYLEIPDFHFGMENKDICINLGHRIASAAEENEVDFIAIPGDWFDKPIVATDKGGLSVAKEIMNEWTDTCPVIAIEGTPSHDGPGCYGIFGGVTVLKPGKVYGLFEEQDDVMGNKYSVIREFGNLDYPECLIFGIPELNKKNIQSQLNLDAEEANQEAIKLFGDYIDNFVAPHRLKYKNLPAIGLFHGNVSDSSQYNETDEILKRSDIVIHTEVLEHANLDRWSLGHIHKPWESEKICAGYAGNWGKTWNETRFKPCFNLVEIEDGNTTVKSIQYGTALRWVVDDNYNDFTPNIAYHIKSTDPDRQLPPGLHPWSKITYEPNKAETRRVTEEEIQNVNSLWDLFKLIDENVPGIKHLVDEIAQEVPSHNINKIDVKLESLKISGCKFFSGKTIELDLSNLSETLNMLSGDNGSGKSSVLGFMHPYPQIIGKDTESGRDSSIQSFFNGKGKIEKNLMVNGDTHRHLIDIKKDKKECYIFVNDKPILDKGTFDEMSEECVKLYGNFEDYRITTFFEQPQQSANGLSGLMVAGKTMARNIIQNIAGIDRDKEKRYALDKVSEYDKSITKAENQLEVLKEYNLDPEPISLEINNLEKELSLKNQDLQESIKKGNSLKEEVKAFEEKFRRSNEAKIIMESDKKNLERIKRDIEDLESQIKHNLELAAKVPTIDKILDENEQSVTRKNELEHQYQKIKDVNIKTKEDWQDKSGDYILKIHRIEKEEAEMHHRKKEIRTRIKTLTHNINLINKPCEFCNKVASDSKNEISKYKKEIESLTEEKQRIEEELNNIIKPIKPEEPKYLIFPHQEELDSIEILTLDSISDLTTKLAHGESAEENNKEYFNSIELNNKSIYDLQKKIDENILTYDPSIEYALSKAKEKLENARLVYSNTNMLILNMNAKIKTLEEQLRQIKITKTKIEELDKDIITNSELRLSWNYIAKMLNPDKIPALELDIMLESIDSLATKNIQSFLDGRYVFRTETQKQGKKSKVDKFDILIYDSETGEEASFFTKNPGHRAFFNDAYVKALIQKRKEKAHIEYSPIIYDESDNPIRADKISMFYEQHQDYYTNKDCKVFIVSQKENEASSFIQNVIDIEELKSE